LVSTGPGLGLLTGGGGGANDGAGLTGADVVLASGDGDDVSVEVDESLGLGAGLVLVLALTGGGGADVGCPGFGDFGLQDGEGAELEFPEPSADRVPPLCWAPIPGAPEWPPFLGPPPDGEVDELLGKIAVEASIATYVPAATMNITTAIAASGRSKPCARERCRPGACVGANRSPTSRNQSATL